jgi:hypothetical protein
VQSRRSLMRAHPKERLCGHIGCRRELTSVQRLELSVTIPGEAPGIRSVGTFAGLDKFTTLIIFGPHCRPFSRRLELLPIFGHACVASTVSELNEKIYATTTLQSDAQPTTDTQKLELVHEVINGRIPILFIAICYALRA